MKSDEQVKYEEFIHDRGRGRKSRARASPCMRFSIIS